MWKKCDFWLILPAHLPYYTEVAHFPSFHLTSLNMIDLCRFLAHPISQAILADLWMGGLRMRKNPIFKIILGLLCPPSIAKLEFKTREELELMPQTEEELQVR